MNIFSENGSYNNHNNYQSEKLEFEEDYISKTSFQRYLMDFTSPKKFERVVAMLRGISAQSKYSLY